MKQRIFTLILVVGIRFVHSIGPKWRFNDGPLKIGRRLVDTQDEVDNGLWFSKGSYDIPLVNEKIVPPPPPPDRVGCSGVLPPGVTCSPSPNPSLVPAQSASQTLNPSAGPLSPPSAPPSRQPVPSPTNYIFSAIPSVSNYPSTLPTSPTAATRMPTKFPIISAIPSVSNYPSTSPTNSAPVPHGVPLASQSALPPSQNQPSSHRPTNVPTKLSTIVSPSLPPIRPPTSVPTKLPVTFTSPSLPPTFLPTKVPTETPLFVPPSLPPTSTKPPTKMPTISPSPQPSSSPSPALTSSPASSPSRLPSRAPSVVFTSVQPKSPSMAPSDHPSDHPSQAPSSEPSASPTTSAAPTVLLFNTRPTSDSKGDVGENSTCLTSPPNTTAPQTQVLTFNYNIFLAQGSNPNNQTGPIESRLQRSLAYYYLKCKFHRRQLQGSGFYVTQVLSLPLDTLSSTACSANETVSNATCYVVNGGITVELLFSNTRTAVNILSSFGAFLASEMDGGRLNGGDVVGMNFLGFTNVGGATGTVPDTTAASAQQATSTNSSTTPSIGIVAGSVAVAAAVLVLVLVLFLVYRRKRGGRRQVYLKQDEYVIEEIGGDEETDMGTEMNMKSIVVDDDENSFSNSLKGIKLEKKDDGDLSEKYGQVHKCASASCEICQNAKRPTFVTADWRELRDQLGSSKQNPKPRQHLADDTVDL